ncbi:MAG: hypothetical protein PHP34_06065 [Bacteroidales bacterium]|nr:hypothetical protein [Bacteroidales bacterium]
MMKITYTRMTIKEIRNLSVFTPSSFVTETFGLVYTKRMEKKPISINSNGMAIINGNKYSGKAYFKTKYSAPNSTAINATK